MKSDKFVNRESDYKNLEYSLRHSEFKYSLLNFAAVIAEVLAGSSPLNKDIPGFKRIDIKDTRNIIVKIVKECKRLSSDPVIKLFSEIGPQFKSHSETIEQTLKELDERVEMVVGCPLYPGLDKKPRAIKKINQIAILWIPGLTDKKQKIHWEELVELFYWFEKRLRNAVYFADVNPACLKPKALQTLNARIRRNRELLLGFSSSLHGVPDVWQNRPLIRVSHEDSRLFGFPINSIEFYPDRIRTLFEMDEGTFVRETVFRKSGEPSSSLYTHDPSREKTKANNIVLEIHN